MARAVKKLTVAILLVGLVALLALQARFIEYDSSDWLDKDNEARQAKQLLQEEYDNGEIMVLAIPLDSSSTKIPVDGYFTPQVFDALRVLEDGIRALPEVVTTESPLTATTILQKENVLSILTFDEAMERELLTSIAHYQQELMDSEYAGRLISYNQDAFAVVVTVDAPFGADNYDARLTVYRHAQSLIEQSSVFRDVHLTGEIAINYLLDYRTRTNLAYLSVISIIAIMILTCLLFRDAGVALTVFVSASSAVILSMAVMVTIGHPLTVIGLTLPVLIMVIAIADSIHIISHYRNARRAIGNTQNTAQLLKETLRRSWRPCLMTSITTAIGFGAFSLSELRPLRFFGIDSFASILSVYPIILFTTLSGLYLLPPGSRFAQRDHIIHTILSGSVKLVQRQRRTILLISMALFVTAGLSFFRARTETNFLDVFFAKNSPTYESFNFVDDNIGGSGAVDILLTGTGPGYFQDIQINQSIIAMEQAFSQEQPVTHVRSYLSPIRMIHRHFTSDGSMLPTQADELEQELLFLEFSRSDGENDVLSEYVDFLYENGRIHLQTPNLTSQEAYDLGKRLEKLPALHNWRYYLTGVSMYFEALSNYVIDTQFSSISISCGIIWLLFIIRFGFRLGTLGMIPNIFPVACILGLWALLGIPFDFATVLIASISLGLCVDDTIHVLDHVHEHRKTLSIQEIEHTIMTIGRPILFTSMLLGIGFVVFVTSSIVVLQKFGIATAIVLILAYIADMLLLPALIVRSNRT